MFHQELTFLTLSPAEINQQATELQTTEQLIRDVLSSRVRSLEGLQTVINGLYGRTPR